MNESFYTKTLNCLVASSWRGLLIDNCSPLQCVWLLWRCYTVDSFIDSWRTVSAHQTQ